MQTGKKGLALLLALLMVFSLLPGSALAADGCLTVKSDAATTYETTQGTLLEITLAGLFTDNGSHALTYTLDSGDYGEHTKIADGKLSFTNPTAGTYTPTVTATCAGGQSASVKLTITVKEGAAGDENQYGYDESDADSVTVYVTISNDGFPIMGSDGTILSHLKVEVPYFDLINQGLDDYHRYHTENGSGSYIDTEIVRRPTLLHLYLYMLGVYYLGYTPEDVMDGAVRITDQGAGAVGSVCYMDGSDAYQDKNPALTISGSATSMFMDNFWGHDLNLMYYRNHVYPLMGSGWGATADYILLSGDDTIDLAMFSDYSFWERGAFAAFDRDDYTVEAGGELKFSTVKYDTKAVADGGTEQLDPITGLDVAVYDEDWGKVDEVTGDGSDYTFTFKNAGTYYLLATDPNARTEDSCYAPATAKVVVNPAPEIAVPTLKAGYPAEKSATVQTGKAYLLSELQRNNVFDPAEGKTLTYENYYYERSTDGGKTWGPRTKFDHALFGGTTIQLTETKAGTYTYRFYASHDGEHFSKDTWTLTLTVEDAPKLNFTFYVGKDYNNNYPIIKLYEVDTDGEGNETLGEEINAFLYSNFKDTLPEGEEAYDAAQGKLVNNYQTFYATLEAGRYAYRAFGKNTETGKYDVALGGMTLDLPTDNNVDGSAAGGTDIYLQCSSFYVDSQKTDKSYFTAEEYHVEVVCPIMKTTCAMGDPYVNGSYAYYPTVLYAGGNACLYNAYAYPNIEGYAFNMSNNLTFNAGSSADSRKLTISTTVTLTVTVPADATFGLYFQKNNFNTIEVEPDGGAEARWTVDETANTKTATYSVSKGSGNYTWRMSDSTHVTQAGWLTFMNTNASKSMTFSFGDSAATNRLSHDTSGLGTQTSKRDEADLQVNLDPSGFETLSGKTRVRAYRHWQLINSDSGNIMVEPDFHWNRETGDAKIETVNGGNAYANWADITPGAQDSIITVYYDSIDVNPSNHGSHGGLFPATAPQRVGVIVVGGTGVTHGTADADVDFNMAAGAATTRSMDWDYNYDTWYYEASETDPTLDFAVTATGNVTVEYAFVAANDSMQRAITGFASAAQRENGRYAVPLKELKTLGNGQGGTVIIKMTDSTGVSYRLVRVAQVTIEAENVSNPEEKIMPGDSVKLTFSGMFRGVNKIAGVFNPTTFNPTYYAGNVKYDGTLDQYQKMDNSSFTVTIPTDIAFAEGADTAEYAFANGYTYGNMLSAANPFAFLYNMPDSGVGTNFNAVTVGFYMNHYADAVVTVYRKVTYETALVAKDASGNAIDGVTVTLTGPDGKTVTAGANGHYDLGYGAYTYKLVKSGYVVRHGSFTLGSADESKVVGGILTIADTMELAGTNAWDGTTQTEPAKDDNGVYQIGTAAELAWFAKSDGNSSAALTADIELAGYDWTPMNKLYGTFDGNGHTVKNLYINSSTYPLGLFAYVKTGASVTKLGITGDVTCSALKSAQAGGIAGYMETKSSIAQSWSAVNVTTAMHGGGIAGYTCDESSITDCYATGTIRTTSTNECYLGGICGPAFSDSMGAKLTNCYSTATVTGSGGTKSYVGGLTAVTDSYYSVNSYYLSGTVSGEKASGASKLGTALTDEQMKAADFVTRLGEAFTADADGINGGYPVLAWQGGAQPVKGDVNRDGKVDAADAQLVYAYAIGENGTTLTEIQLLIADMDADDKITAKDAAMIFALVTSAAAEVTE